ncbi:hypothetical protein DCC78_07660 [bacterium]|nr:MAG: hypothetical protein DCC78_07660 [bacterium]
MPLGTFGIGAVVNGVEVVGHCPVDSGLSRELRKRGAPGGCHNTQSADREDDAMGAYDQESVRRFFDRFGQREWERLERDVAGQANYAIHRKLLAPEVQPGMRILDAGCGPGRYAIDLIRAGARVTLADLSPVQLELAAGNVRDAGLEGHVDGRHEVDICDLGVFATASFDGVVCYGGALSYTRERHPGALAELVRVVRPGGFLALSAMSLYGILLLLGVLDIPGFLETMPHHLDLGDDPSALPGCVMTVQGSPEFHQPMALFAAQHLQGLVSAAGCDIVRTAVANPLSWGLVALEKTAASAAARETLLELELALCEDPRLADRGDHLIVIARKR